MPSSVISGMEDQILLEHRNAEVSKTASHTCILMTSHKCGFLNSNSVKKCALWVGPANAHVQS